MPNTRLVTFEAFYAIRAPLYVFALHRSLLMCVEQALGAHFLVKFPICLHIPFVNVASNLAATVDPSLTGRAVRDMECIAHFA
mmetsp:Transcript_132058/g.263538  ORF Transcript_132058/g.263538 Transcript_132058/m.263538 type:complete len:83 (-) Transcript_132058:1039-1287(-)